MIEGIVNHPLFMAGAILVGFIGMLIGLESRMERKKLEHISNDIDRLVEERGLCEFVADYLRACQMYPDADVSVWC